MEEGTRPNLEKYAPRKAFYKSTAIAAILTMVFASSAWAIDGLEFSGQNARNEALQTDYGSLIDSYNIWVNPALVNDYSNRVDVNITDDGFPSHTSSDEEMGGVFKTFGNQAVGVYIGRPTDSGLFNTPENQVDLFWGTNIGAAKIGARLNFQAKEDSTGGPTSTNTSPDNTLPTDLSFSTTNITGSSLTEGEEFNLALGAAFGPNSAYEASVIFGQPDATTNSSSSTNAIVDDLNGVDRTVVGRRTTDTVTNSNKESDDDNLGIALRGQIGNYLATISYYTLESGSTTNASTVINDVKDDDLTDGALGADPGDFSTTDTFITVTDATSETDTFGLHGSRSFMPTGSTLIVGALGFEMSDTDTSSRSTRTQHTLTDNIAGTTTFTAPIGTLSSTSGTEEEFEIPLVIAVEGEVNSNWKARASVKKNLYQKKETTTTTTTFFTPTQPLSGPTPRIPEAVDVVTNSSTESIWSDTDTTVALGLGFTRGNATIDAVVQKDFFTRGTDEGITSRV
ncbi:MAG: hypothetical protein ACE5GK_04710, partial [Nitrospiria bacterium]